MKRILLVIFALISLNAFAQLQVKEGSFKHIPGGIIEDKLEYTDGNDFPMALIKISTENIAEQERHRLVFSGNRETQFIKKPKTGQMWVYLSAEAATFIDIKHPDYGTCKYYLPEKLCDYCVYEMVLQYIPIAPAPTNEPAKLKKTYLIVKSDQADARIYIDDELINTHEASKAVDVGTLHTYKIECNLYHSESGTVTVNDRTEIYKKLRPNFGYINISSSPEQGAKAFVDGDYIGLTPIKTDKLESGSHKVMVMKDMYKMKEQSFTVTDGQTTNATLNMSANFVNVTVNTDSQSDIYVDEEYKGKGKWTGRLSDGSHIFEARKTNHKTSVKSMDLALGETKTITLDAPQAINGDIDINTSPMGATIYIDGKIYGETPNYISDILIGEHELKLTKQGCAEIKKTIVIKEGETLTINETLQANSQKTSGNNNVASGKINGHEYVDLGLSVKWATCNVGAETPEDYGNYYAWGETTTKSTYTESNSKTYGKNINDIKGNSQYDAARANWGGTWRLPTKTELEELIENCTWTWTTQNGVDGYKVTSKKNGNTIFLPAAGFRYGSSLYYAGSYGNYWSSTPGGGYDNYNAYNIVGRRMEMDYDFREYGRSVRPVVE